MDSVSAVWVRVSLGAYFSDERARCMMTVPGGAAGARRAGWLARRLRRTFGLPRRPALLCQGHLLPPAEPLPAAPLLELEAVPPSGRVVDVSRQRRCEDEGDPRPAPPRPSCRVGHSADEGDPRPAPPRPSCRVGHSADEGDPRPEPPPPSSRAECAADEIRQLEESSECPDASAPDDVDARGPPSSPCPALEEMKRRALALLEGHEREPAPARRRRRRVRRRRAAPDVLRNEEGSRRAPRRVRALSPPPPADCPRPRSPAADDPLSSS